MKGARLKVSIAGLALVVAAAVAGCGRRVEIGPKPKAYSGGLSSESQTVDAMREWLTSVSGQHAKTLQETGELTIPYSEVRTSYPQQAQVLDSYVGEMQARTVERARAKGLELSPSAIQSISFSKAGKPGAYELAMQFEDGSFSNLILSDPL